MAIFVPRLILNDKQFVEKSFIHSKSTPPAAAFSHEEVKGLEADFRLPSCYRQSADIAEGRAMVTKGIFVCKNLNSLLIFHCYCISLHQVSPWIELHPPGLSTIRYIFLMLFSGFEQSGSHEIQ